MIHTRAQIDDELIKCQEINGLTPGYEAKDASKEENIWLESNLRQDDDDDAQYDEPQAHNS